MTKLAELRSQLSALRHRRASARRWTAACGLLLAVVLALLVIFAVDVLFSMTVMQRLVSIGIGLAAIAWAFRKFVAPWLGHRESDLDMALLVERQQRIDTSDIVAAIQFDSPAAAAWGSGELRSAVIDYVAEFSHGWNVFEGFSRKPLARRAGILVVLLLGIGLAAFFYPAYATTFLNRLALGARHYPTLVRIDRIEINGVENPARAAYGQPLQFKLFVSRSDGGRLPVDGRIELHELTQSQRGRPLDLQPKSADRSLKRDTYEGKMSALLEAIEYQAFVGDDWTEPTRLDVIPLPLVDVKLTPHPPEYARRAPQDPEMPGSRQLLVFEGSRVDLQIQCGNKHLKQAELTIGEERIPLTMIKPFSAGRGGEEIWQLPANRQSPLSSVTATLNYQLNVVDEDQLKPDHPISGSIRIKADGKPTITTKLVTKNVLPIAIPKIEYTIDDDFGVAKVILRGQLIKPDGTTTDIDEVTLLADRVLADRLPQTLGYYWKLEPLKLAKDDQLRIKLEVWDDRGGVAGQSVESQVMQLNVVDISDVLAAQQEFDKAADRGIENISDLQTGKKPQATGGSK